MIIRLKKGQNLLSSQRTKEITDITVLSEKNKGNV